MLLLLVALSDSVVAAQPDSLPADSNRTIRYIKKAVSLAAVSSLFTVTLVDSYLAWWKGNYQPFGFYNSAERGGWLAEPGILGIDKIGHIYGAYFLYSTKKSFLLWGGYSEETATWLAAGFTGGVGVLIELGDGFSDYSFDYRDIICDFTGIGYAMLQEKYPVLQNFSLKYSYIPPDRFSLRFTQHYDGNVFWLTANIHNLFKDGVGDYVPEWIQPAVGFSVGGKGSYRELLVGLDFNLNSLFPKDDANWEVLRKLLNLFHIPAPGVKFAPGRAPEYRLFLLN